MKCTREIQVSIPQQRAHFLAATIASVMLMATVSAPASPTDCSQSMQANNNCKRPALHQPLQKTAHPHATTTPAARPADGASKRDIIFVGGRVGPRTDTHAINSQPVPPGRGETRAINSQPVPPGHSDKRAINSQPVPPGRTVHKAPQPGDPVEDSGRARGQQSTETR